MPNEIVSFVGLLPEIDRNIEMLMKEHGNNKYMMGQLHAYQNIRDSILRVKQELDKDIEYWFVSDETPDYCPICSFLGDDSKHKEHDPHLNFLVQTIENTLNAYFGKTTHNKEVQS
jgi:hypothetical protein